MRYATDYPMCIQGIHCCFQFGNLATDPFNAEINETEKNQARAAIVSNTKYVESNISQKVSIICQNQRANQIKPNI